MIKRVWLYFALCFRSTTCIVQHQTSWSLDRLANVTTSCSSGEAVVGAGLLQRHIHDSGVPAQSVLWAMSSSSKEIRWATHPNKCIDIQGGGTANGNNVMLWDCGAANPNQQFSVPAAAVPGQIQWVSHPNKCLDVQGGGTSNGNDIFLWDCKTAHPNQMFLVGRGGVPDTIRWSTHPNKCLDVRGGSTRNGNNIQLYDCDGYGPNRMFLHYQGCSAAGTDRFNPDLGGCCSGLVTCEEPRTDPSTYCDQTDPSWGKSCWDTMIMCRSQCVEPTDAPTLEPTHMPTPQPTQTPTTPTLAPTQQVLWPVLRFSQKCELWGVLPPAQKYNFSTQLECQNQAINNGHAFYQYGGSTGFGCATMASCEKRIGDARWTVFEQTSSHFIAQGDPSHSCADPDVGCGSRLSTDSDIHAVRCCSETQTSWHTNRQCLGLSSASNIWPEGCLRMNWRDATEFCASVSGRLCTKEEVERGCAAGSGCDYDRHMIWTSTDGELCDVLASMIDVQNDLSHKQWCSVYSNDKSKCLNSYYSWYPYPGTVKRIREYSLCKYTAEDSRCRRAKIPPQPYWCEERFKLPSEGVLVLDGGDGENPAWTCIQQGSQTKVGDTLIAAQCCEGNSNGTCRRSIGSEDRTGCISGKHPNIMALTYEQAMRKCAKQGLQLCNESCTVEGCGYNNYPVWTSIQCEAATMNSTIIQTGVSTSGGRTYLSHNQDNSVSLWSTLGMKERWRIDHIRDDLYSIQAVANASEEGPAYLSHDSTQSVEMRAEGISGIQDEQVWRIHDEGTSENGRMYTIQTVPSRQHPTKYLQYDGAHGVALAFNAVKWSIQGLQAPTPAPTLYTDPTPAPPSPPPTRANPSWFGISGKYNENRVNCTRQEISFSLPQDKLQTGEDMCISKGLFCKEMLTFDGCAAEPCDSKISDWHVVYCGIGAKGCEEFTNGFCDDDVGCFEFRGNTECFKSEEDSRKRGGRCRCRNYPDECATAASSSLPYRNATICTKRLEGPLLNGPVNSTGGNAQAFGQDVLNILRSSSR